MKTRRRIYNPVTGAPTTNLRKRAKLSSTRCNFFDMLPDDIVLLILVRVGSTAECPADFVAGLITCRRFNSLGLNSLVLSKASAETFAVKAEKWSEFAHRFLQRCSDAGNVEASYTLGMIQFYCFQNRRLGAVLIAKAAIKSHAAALYSLAIIQFNGSGGSKNIKDLIGGVTLCARAAFLGFIDALRELGHCLKDGYGIAKNIHQGQRFLLEANARELATICSKHSSRINVHMHMHMHLHSLVSDFGFCLTSMRAHPANRFLVDWFRDRGLGPGLRVCSYGGCGRTETRVNEFRRCSVCSVVSYCSRGCQAHDWTMGHNKSCCTPVRFVNVDDGER